MKNIKLTISYDGSKFDGSAIQPKKLTVQGELTKALKTLGCDGKTVFSGRTDKDVHSTNQVVSFQIPPFWEDLEKLNSLDFIKKLPILDKNILIKNYVEIKKISI